MRKALIAAAAATAAAAAAAAAFVPTIGHSQEISQATVVTLPIKPEDIGAYCIYGNKVYSAGSQLCIDVVRAGPPAQTALLCKLPAAAGARATWEPSGSIICANPPTR